MSNILQRHWFTTVRKEPKEDMLVAQTVYCGSDREVNAQLKVEPTSFKIIDATWEEYSPSLKIMDIPKLHGVQAYFNCGSMLKEAFSELGEFTYSIFAETVRGLIQAETFLYKERGFASATEYSNYWEKFYNNSCCYYSNLDKISRSWDDYTCSFRTNNLFNRFKSHSVYTDLGGGYKVSGKLSDSFHELSVQLIVDSQLKIIEAQGDLLRVPDEICKEATVFLSRLLDQDIKRLNKKQLADILGKGEGCVHLIDTVYDALESVKISLD